MSEIGKLQNAIKELHGCDSRHLGSIRVHDTFQDRMAWDGIVEVFFLIDHRHAKEAYAWPHKAGNGETKYVAILAISPVESPSDAVRAYVTSEAEKQK
jgi:hypothetical protein